MKERLSDNRRQIFDCVLIFLLCFVPRLILTARVLPLNFMSDETSALYIAAAVAGYDWSDVVSHAGYYGIGFLWIFAPLFKLGLPAVAIYRTIATCLAAVNALTGPIFYAMMGRFFGIGNRLRKVVMAAVCGNLILFYVATLATRNEEILALLVCLTAYLLCRLVQEHKVRDEVLLMLVMLYALTCHTRAVAILIAVLAVGILYAIFYRKKLFHIVTYVLCFVGYVGVTRLLDLYRNGVWGRTNVSNSSVSSAVSSSARNILANGDIGGMLKSWIRIVGGQIFTASTVTGGLFLIATIVCLVYLFYFLSKKKEGSTEMLFVLSLVGLILVYGTMFTQGITWLNGVYNGIYVQESFTYIYSYKAFTYIRYCGPYVPMLVTTAFCAWETDRYAQDSHSLLKKSVIAAIPCYLLLLLLWVKCILPFLGSQKPEYFYFTAGFIHSKSAQPANWACACIIGCAVLVLYLVVALRERVVIGLTVSLVLLVGGEISAFQNLTLYVEKRRYSYADAGYELISSMDGILGEDIYVYDKNSSNQVWYLYHFLKYKYHIIPSEPEDTEEAFILFSNSEVELDGDGIVAYQLDDNEFVYTNVPTYQEFIDGFQ